MNDETKQTARLTVKAKEISSTELLDGARELIIIHNNERYSLRITANRKLILTK